MSDEFELRRTLPLEIVRAWARAQLGARPDTPDPVVWCRRCGERTAAQVHPAMAGHLGPGDPLLCCDCGRPVDAVPF
jgi:hypothetical protein